MHKWDRYEIDSSSHLQSKSTEDCIFLFYSTGKLTMNNRCYYNHIKCYWVTLENMPLISPGFKLTKGRNKLLAGQLRLIDSHVNQDCQTCMGWRPLSYNSLSRQSLSLNKHTYTLLHALIWPHIMTVICICQLSDTLSSQDFRKQNCAFCVDHNSYMGLMNDTLDRQELSK